MACRSPGARTKEEAFVSMELSDSPFASSFASFLRKDDLNFQSSVARQCPVRLNKMNYIINAATYRLHNLASVRASVNTPKPSEVSAHAIGTVRWPGPLIWFRSRTQVSTSPALWVIETVRDLIGAAAGNVASSSPIELFFMAQTTWTEGKGNEQRPGYNFWK